MGHIGSRLCFALKTTRLELESRTLASERDKSGSGIPGMRSARGREAPLNRNPRESTVADLILRVESSSELDGINYLKQLAVKGVGSAHSRRAYADRDRGVRQLESAQRPASGSTPASSAPTRLTWPTPRTHHNGQRQPARPFDRQRQDGGGPLAGPLRRRRGLDHGGRRGTDIAAGPLAPGHRPPRRAAHAAGRRAALFAPP